MSDLTGYLNRIADQINRTRMRICAYGADENETCDCKYGLSGDSKPLVSEKTGCPELRDIVKAYRECAEKS